MITLDVGSFEEEDILPPDVVGLGDFLEALAEGDLEGNDRAGHPSLQKGYPLLVLEGQPGVH
jgi:hypothetical protein